MPMVMLAPARHCWYFDGYRALFGMGGFVMALPVLALGAGGGQLGVCFTFF